MECHLCSHTGGELLWRDERCRVIHVVEPGYPGFCRVVWEAHAKEMTDLSDADRLHLMEVVFAVESVLREQLQPDKINLASFGNQVPHLHWHVIPRYRDDPHFPEPAWGPTARPRDSVMREVSTATLASALAAALD
jgi:diadenosine tetraphosphate (Ap4A) HIT family hydrolase